MTRFDRVLHSTGGRLLALFLCFLLTAASCNPGGTPLAPQSGVRDYQGLAFVEVPHGRVNAAGGNLVIERVDLSIDTRLGTRAVGAVYNSQSGLWTWSFDLYYDGAVFVDATGARFDVAGTGSGEALPGSHWVVLDATQVKTKGGLLHAFDPSSGKLDHVRWSSSDYPRLRTLRAQVAGESRITALEQCRTSPADCSLVVAVDYDAQGRVVRLFDRAGRETAYAYDGAGLLASARDALDLERGWPGTAYEYDGTLLEAVTSSEGERVEYTYRGRRLQSATRTGGGEPTRLFRYTAAEAGLYTTRFFDETGAETRIRYDNSRRVVERTQVDLQETTTWTWSGLRPTGRTEPSGVSWSGSWAGDDLMSETTASGNVRTIQYAPGAVDREHPHQRPVARVSDSLGVVEERVYDAQGRLVSHSNGAGDTTTWSYKPNEMIDTVTRPGGVVVELAGYGEHGHASSIETAGSVVGRSFDAVGNRLTGPGRGPEMPGVVSRRYDGDRNAVELVVGDHFLLGSTTTASISMEYRSDGRPTAIRRPGSGDHELDYDAHGRLVATRERVDGVWRTTAFSHDAAGRVTAVERPNGMRVEWERDAAGRVVVQRGLRHGVLESEVELVYTAGRLVRVDDSLREGSETLVYDAAGRVSAVGHPDGEATVFYHDLRGRTVRERFYDPGLALVADLATTWDAADRRASVSEGGELLVAWAYTDGRRSEVTYGNGLVRSYGYDATGELATAEMRTAGGSLVESTTIDQTLALSTRVVEVRTETFGALPVATEEVYQLSPSEPGVDPNGMVGRRVTGWAPAVAATTESLVYDVLGNLVSVDDRPFVYNAERNRLLSVESAGSGSLAYAYDEAGFATSRGGETLSWTALGRLAAHGDDSFGWDSLGRPTGMTLDGVTTRTRWGARIVTAADGTPLGLDGEEFQIDLVGGAHLFRHFDFRGNVKLVSDDTGDVVTHYRYRPHRVDAVFGDATDGVRFAGRSEIGDLMILGARIYDPLAGAFLSPDPILNAMNQYAYTLGNPVEFQDRDGLLTMVEFAAGVLGATGANLVAQGVGAAVAGALVAGSLLIGLGLLFILLGLGILYWGKAVTTPDAQPAGSPSDPGGLGSSHSVQPSGSPGGCSAPAALVHVPLGRSWLALLVSAQLLLGLCWLRRRRLGTSGG